MTTVSTTFGTVAALMTAARDVVNSRGLNQQDRETHSQLRAKMIEICNDEAKLARLFDALDRLEQHSRVLMHADCTVDFKA